MRLIDENVALKRFIQETEASGKNVIHINTIKRILQDIPTAYNVEKVAEEVRISCCCMGFDESQMEILVEDVRMGGVE